MIFTASEQDERTFIFTGYVVVVYTMYLNFHGIAPNGYGYEVYA